MTCPTKRLLVPAKRSGEAVGWDWLEDLRKYFPEEFADEHDTAAQQHVEGPSERPAMGKRY